VVVAVDSSRVADSDRAVAAAVETRSSALVAAAVVVVTRSRSRAAAVAAVDRSRAAAVNQKKFRSEFSHQSRARRPALFLFS